MVRNILRLLLLVCLTFAFSSCSRLFESSTIIAGNQKFRSGENQDSIIDYLKGVSSDTNKDYFYYNLGNVYSSLGESPAAFSVWDLADGRTNSNLKFNLLYNRGVLEYQEGNYKISYNQFKQALILIPSSIKAKINLELSLNKMSVANYNQISELNTSDSDIEGATDETTRILEYVKQKEAMSWGLNYQNQDQENDW